MAFGVGIFVALVAVFIAVFIGWVAAVSTRNYRPEEHVSLVDLHLKQNSK